MFDASQHARGVRGHACELHGQYLKQVFDRRRSGMPSARRKRRLGPLPMTLICRFTARQVPTVYLGDLLLTTEGKSTKPLHLPSWSDINSRLAVGAERYVSGLTQKLNILSERVIVAWAGSRIQAISMLRMIEQAANQRAGFDEIGRLVGAVPKEDRDKLHLIGSVIEPSPDQQAYEVKHFSALARKQCVEGIEITADGTGVDFLFALAPQLLERMSGQTDKYRIALGLSMGVSASLIGHETATGANLTEWWGGGIETAVLDNGNFTKIGNTLHTLWTATIRADGDIDFVLLPKFIKYDYLQDALVVRAIEIDLSGPTEGNARLTHGIHTFTPLLKDKNHYDWNRVRILRSITIGCVPASPLKASRAKKASNRCSPSYARAAISQDSCLKRMAISSALDFTAALLLISTEK